MAWDILLVVATALEMGRTTVATSLARSMSGQRCKMETRKNMSFYLVADPARRHRRRSSSHLHLHLHRPPSSLFASSICPSPPDAILSTAIAATISLSPATSSAARESPMSAVPGPAGSLPSQRSSRKSPTTLQPAPADFPHSLHRTASHTSQASARVPSPQLSARSFSPKGQFTPRIMSRRGSAQTGIEYPYRTLSRTSSPKDAPSYTPASVYEEGWRTPATDYTPGEV